MPNQYPFGDAFLVSTPATDRMAALLQQEQRQREAGRRQQLAAIDQEGQKLYGDLRNAEDAKDFTGAYNQYKALKMNVMRMNPNDPKFLDAQAAANKAYSDAIGIARDSKQANEDEKSMRDNMEKNWEQYDDNAYNLFGIRRQTGVRRLKHYQYPDPKTGQLTTIDLTNPDAYRYKGDNFDESKIEKEARGLPKVRYEVEEGVPGDDLSRRQRQYSFGNDPMTYYQQTVGGLYTRNGGRHAEAVWKNTDKDLVAAVQEKFQQLPKEKWQQMTGSDKPQDLLIKDSDPVSVKYAKHKAQLYALNESPSVQLGNPYMNQAAKDARDFAQQKQMEGIRHANAISLQGNALKNAKKLAQFRKDIGGDGGGGDKDETWVDNYLNDLTSNLGQGFNYKTTDGTTNVEHEVKLDPVLKKSLAVTHEGKSIEPDKLLYNSQTKEYRPLYYQTDKDFKPIKGENGKMAVEPQLSQPLTKDQLKLALGVKTLNAKQRAQTMNTKKAVLD